MINDSLSSVINKQLNRILVTVEEKSDKL